MTAGQISLHVGEFFAENILVRNILLQNALDRGRDSRHALHALFCC
jgi:hypothetical protein